MEAQRTFHKTISDLDLVNLKVYIAHIKYFNCAKYRNYMFKAMFEISLVTMSLDIHNVLTLKTKVFCPFYVLSIYKV